MPGEGGGGGGWEGGGGDGGGHVVDWTKGECYKMQEFCLQFFEFLRL